MDSDELSLLVAGVVAPERVVSSIVLAGLAYPLAALLGHGVF